MPITLTPISSTADLISLARAVENPALAAVQTSDPDYLASLITAASDAIRRQCHRDFTLAAYSEYHGGGVYTRQPLRLRQFPVTRVDRVAAAPRAALRVSNEDALSNQRATVATTGDGISLLRVASAANVAGTLAFVDYPTLGAMAVAINALGGGWRASALEAFANWPSADLRPLQGATTALGGGCALEVYVETIGACIEDLTADSFASGWRLDPRTGELYARFPRGHLNIRIDYQAGFAAIPEAVAEACVQLVRDLYDAGQVNNSVASATLGNMSVTAKNQSAISMMSSKVLDLLAPYVDHAKIIQR